VDQWDVWIAYLLIILATYSLEANKCTFRNSKKLRISSRDVIIVSYDIHNKYGLFVQKAFVDRSFQVKQNLLSVR
jgi:hypothetical protein